MTLFVRQQTPELVERQRTYDGRARGERPLRRLVTWATSLDQLVIGLNPFRELQKASQLFCFSRNGTNRLLE